MQKTVYYLVHKDTNRRVKWYRTLAGARIAQRSRNHKLGFQHRLERVQEHQLELELCVNTNNDMILATYAIIEDTVEQNELTSSGE